DPDTKQVVGKYVILRGEVLVSEVKKGKAARGVIGDVTSEGTIERGERVGPLKTQLHSVADVPNEASVEAVIVGVIGSDRIIGTGQVVFLDRGRVDGVKPGNRLQVVRRGDAYPETGALSEAKDDRHFPDTEYGTILVLETGDKTSVG